MHESAKVKPLTQNSTASSSIRGTSSQDVKREKSSSRFRPWIFGAIIFLLLGVIAYPTLSQWFNTERTVTRSQLRYSTVSEQTFVRDVSAQGVVVAAISPTLYASSAGTVTLMVKAGDQVAEGDLIATLVSPEVNNELEREQATFNSLQTNLQRQTIENKKLMLAAQQTVDLAQVDLIAAERELRRAEQSWEHKVISLQDFEKAADDVEKARFGLQHAEKAAVLDKESLGFDLATLRLQRDRQKLSVANLQRRVDELQLRAPVSGIVGTLAVNRRAVVPANAEIATIIDLSALEIDLSISDSYADDLTIGAEVIVKFSGEEHAATLVSVSPEVRNSTVSGRVRFDSEKPTGLRQNQRVSARIILESKEAALVIDRGPFYDTGGGRVIYRVRGDVAERVTIVTGSTSVSKVEILQGLAAGDQVVISEINTFKDSERVLLRD